jgi:hypothetical protein
MQASTTIDRHAADLAWSLWTELGVAGVVRRHASLVVDPELLVAATPELAHSDRRLQEEVLHWCLTHADRLSESRLRGLVTALPDSPRERFDEFSDQLRRRSRAPSQGARAERVSDVAAARPPVRLPLERPSLLRLRLRALCGVGARADVLATMLVHRAQWTSAAELAATGYAKRTVARILTELADAGVATRRAEGNVLRFRIAHPDSLATTVGDARLPEPQWAAVFGVFFDLLNLVRLGERAAPVRRVAAHATRERLAAWCAQLGLDPPLPTRGVPDAWDDLLAWGAEATRHLAEGLLPSD